MSNEFFTTEHTQILQKLINEVVNDPTTYRGSEILPSVAIPVRTIMTEVIEATGGLTSEHTMGTDPTYIRSFGTRVQKFEPPAYKEAIHYNEKDILNLRELGQNDRSRRGIRQRLDKDIDRLNRRIEARIEKQRWDAIFTGGFSYMGETFSYGIPAGNRGTSLGAVWSTDGINANASANPLQDIRYWTTGGFAPYRKYKISKIWMNGNTSRWLLDNPNVRAYIANAYANPNIAKYDINAIMQFFIPGCPPVEIYDGWYQTESVNVNDKLVVSDAIYFLPDGYIYFECALPGGDKIGEFVQGINLSSGTVDDPGFGKFLVVEENIAPGTKGGPANPYIDVIGGVYGGIKLDMPFNTLTAKVIA